MAQQAGFLWYKQVIASIVLMFVAIGILQAAPVDDPVKLVDHVANSVLRELKANKKKIASNPEDLYKIVDDLVLPYVDLLEMSKWIAGKSGWNTASSEVQNKFIKEFKVLLLRTYAVTLNNYTDEVLAVHPLEKLPNTKRVQVYSKIARLNKEDININYRLINKDSTWALYDVLIEGVSILKGFQAQFSDDIRQFGLGYVADKIYQHNQEKQKQQK